MPYVWGKLVMKEMFEGLRHPTDDERLRWFREAKFGLFIHWGLYAQLEGYYKGKPIRGIGEQIMRFAEIPVDEYKQIAKDFNPVKFDADEWVSIAKDAGMKYLVITSKHHDGFAMFKSKASDFNIVDATPYGKDPLAELAKACQKHGIKLCFYYSQYQDWVDPNGAFFWKQWPGTYDDEGKIFETYMDSKAIPQIVELLTNYGPIGLIWYDTPGSQSLYNARRFRDIVHAIQPYCIVGPRVGQGQGDYIGYGDNQVPNHINNSPWESPATMNHTWGFKLQDTDWKSTATLLRLLVSIVGKGGNYLLNVGPTKEGLIPEESKKRLAEIGKWMRKNGESIYQAKECLLPFTPPWGAVTASECRIYLHIFDWKPGQMVIPGIKNKVHDVSLLSTGEKVLFVQNRSNNSELTLTTLTLPHEAPDESVSVIALDVEGYPEMSSIITQYNHQVILPAHMGSLLSDEDQMPALRGVPAFKVDNNGVIENWYRIIDYIKWDFHLLHPGRYQLKMNTFTENQTSACDDMPWEGGHIFQIDVNNQTITLKADEKERFFPQNLFHRQNIVSYANEDIIFDHPGRYTLLLKPTKLVTELGLGPRLSSLILQKTS
jgi:alpha-L-fucosidase